MTNYIQKLVNLDIIFSANCLAQKQMNQGHITAVGWTRKEHLSSKKTH